MQHKQDLAIVLRSIPFEERHRIITALTENHGQITVLAHNAIQSRRFGGTLELFSASEWSFVEKPGAELHRLDQSVIRRAYEGIRQDFQRLTLGSVMSELMLRLSPKHQSCTELFRLHSNALAALEEDTFSTEPTHAGEFALLNGYLAKLLQWSGSQPRLLSCLDCGISLEEQLNLEEESLLQCSVSDAGWVCLSCFSLPHRKAREKENRQVGAFQTSFLQLTPLAALDFYVSQQLPIRKIAAATQASRREHKDLFRFLEALLVYHVPGFDRTPLKSLRFIDSL